MLKYISKPYPKTGNVIQLFVVLAIVLLGVLISLLQFLYNRSLWNDEAMLALNIIEKGFGELLKPLDFNQVAPVLYLQFTKVFSLIIPNSEFGLRLFSLICFWTSLVLFYKSLRILFKQHILIIIALSLFAFNHSLVYFSSELKQYMADVLISVLFLYLVLRHEKLSVSDCVIFSVSGVLAIFLSNITPFILFSSGIYLFFVGRPPITKERLLKLTLIGALWLTSFLAYYMMFIYDHPSQSFMKEYWRNFGAFLPQNPFSEEFFAFFIQKIKKQGHFVYAGMWTFFAGFIILAVIGIVDILKSKRPWLMLFLLLPPVIHLVLSAFDMYPFGRRLTLYLIPYLILFGTYGIRALLIWTGFMAKARLLTVVGILIPLVSIGFLLVEFPKQRQEIKLVLNYIRAHPMSEKDLFLNRRAIPAFSYYEKTGFVDIADFKQVLYGSRSEAANIYLLDLLISKDAGFWLLLSHYDIIEKKFLMDYLAGKEYSPAKSYQVPGAAVYYFHPELKRVYD